MDWGKLKRKICPKCGYRLKKVDLKDNRSFIGCEGYPECRFTIGIERYKEICASLEHAERRKDERLAAPSPRAKTKNRMH